MRKRFNVLTILLGALLMSCHQKEDVRRQPAPSKKSVVSNIDTTEADAFKGHKIPVLCYHAIRAVSQSDSPEQKAYSVTPENFELQIRTLSEQGYSSVTPEQIRSYQSGKASLPAKPIMISFDDGRKDQFSIGAPILEKYNFRGVFYIMTVALGKNRYMTREDVRALSSRRHVIGCHSWDHHKVTSYKNDDWNIQMTKPKKLLEQITGKPVNSFAYPYGVWDAEAADSLKNKGFETAFIFYGKQDSIRPMYTIERINGPNISDMKKFLSRIEAVNN